MSSNFGACTNLRAGPGFLACAPLPAGGLPSHVRGIEARREHFFVKKMEIGLDRMLATWYKNKQGAILDLWLRPAVIWVVFEDRPGRYRNVKRTVVILILKEACYV